RDKDAPGLAVATRYDALLADHGLGVTLRYPWVMAGSARSSQGWKLHLSSIQTEAAGLLARVVPELKSAKVPFKVIRDSALLAQLNEGSLGITQVGKFLTIYPDSDSGARRLAERLIAITRGFHGPVITTDLRLGGVVYARYGAFNPVATRDRLGQQALFIRDPEGNLRRDTYEVPFSMPPGIAN